MSIWDKKWSENLSKSLLGLMLIKRQRLLERKKENIEKEIGYIDSIINQWHEELKEEREKDESR